MFRLSGPGNKRNYEFQHPEHLTMSAAGFKERPRLPSIYSTLQPLEGYWNAYQPYGEDASLKEFVNPLDAFLAYLALDSLPGLPTVVDLAAVSSGGATSLIGLLHPRVGQVLAASDPGQEASERVFAALEGFAAERWAKRTGLGIVPRAELLGKRPFRGPQVILVDAQWVDGQSFDRLIQDWLVALPGAMFVVFNLGRAGECPAVEALVSLCRTSGPNRLWLMRESGEVLVASRMAIVASKDHPHAEDVILRLRQQFTGNHHVLELLNAENLARVQATNVDVELIKAFPDWPISKELEDHKRSAQAAPTKRRRCGTGSMNFSTNLESALCLRRPAVVVVGSLGS